jgi:hypothetical protein
MHRTFARVLAGLAVSLSAAALTACSTPTTPHWTDDGVHVVDGYWITAERPCEITTEGCLAAVRAAEVSMDIPAEEVTGAATARIPNHWVRADGKPAIILATGEREFVILDLADGTRRVIVYGCGGISVVEGVRPCGAYVDDTYAVGHSPFP